MLSHREGGEPCGPHGAHMDVFLFLVFQELCFLLILNYITNIPSLVISGYTSFTGVQLPG